MFFLLFAHGAKAYRESVGSARYHAAMSLEKMRIIAADIKLAHSVFALPFAILGAFLAASASETGISWGPFSAQLGLIILAMVLARTAAMIANRILDAGFDAENPRTSGRAIPSGRLARRDAIIAWVVTAILFLVVCALFGLIYANWWPLCLGTPVVLWISLYGLAKRFTQFCHVWLGSSLALSPLAAAIAIEPSSLTASPAIWLLALMVLLWVAGFDVIYALQDVEIDERDGLRSMPSAMGVAGALLVARLMHVASVIALLGVIWVVPQFGSLMLAAAGMMAALLLVEHLTVRQWGTSRMGLTFFTLNGVVSCLVGLVGVTDIILL
ncbi:MAG TPA: 4-hydroxybenzoate octaprenyltransferase [Phycisphaerales bacterium]|nr:4-hydroxybenzoate octaprenyltransferase [Phycisphaerales bacterium]